MNGKKTYFIRALVILFSFLFLSPAYAQHRKMTTKEYIKKYKDIAIKDMKTYKIPASITLAQGILESGSGNSILARKANNHFGIKCHNGWKGPTIHVADDTKHDCFRKYKSAEASYRDHSKFLRKGSRYAFLFKYPITDYRSWAYGLKRAGYATNPRYPELLIHYIQKYHLYKYDKEGLKRKHHHRHSKRKALRYATPQIASFPKIGTSQFGRPILENNNRRVIVVKRGDTFKKIASEFEIRLHRLLSYNDLKKSDIIHPGELLYLQKKASRAQKGYKYHIVKEGESLWGISQLYGIRLNKLLDMNNFPHHYQAAAGTRIRVR
ncbi:glucosaminidase domain-containing protein [Candidatus Sulfidibacterium hydrothermale]|uniref:glucosaminidase domain-containing protein n=1 Tax=Candidatus Sulfidibacterium hydrothermale TaxID=2875962 RepID=UPI001F0B3680|nr:glucosaminidase domain-containing protein [Candidatus Sulfidibacterium hydrothermale]UBM63285.1 glucosaminidase domain-containing protein [Candidatus Sulfidibacterium hydrothermale]